MVTLASAARSRLCTHMDIQEALRWSSLYNPDMHKRISARCTSAVPEAAAELQRNARTAPSSVPPTCAAKGDNGGASTPTATAAAAAHSCRCPAAGASTGSRGSVLRTWGPAAAPSSIDRPQRTAPASANRAPMRVPIFETRRRGGSERGAHAPSRAQHARIVQDSRPPAGGSPLAPSVSCSWRHLDAAESEKARVSVADWSCMDMTHVTDPFPDARKKYASAARHAWGNRWQGTHLPLGSCAEPCCAANEKAAGPK